MTKTLADLYTIIDDHRDSCAPGSKCQLYQDLVADMHRLWHVHPGSAEAKDAIVTGRAWEYWADLK